MSLVPPEVGRVSFSPRRALWLWGMLVPGLVFGVRALDGTTLAVSLALTFATLCLGHSVGLHRGVIHRTYRASPLVRGVLVYLFVLSGLGGPLSWARLHATRDYWQNRADCPRYFAYGHGLARDFVWNLHMKFEPADARADAKLHPDVLRDPWLRFLEKTWPIHVGLLAVVVGLALGPAAVATCVCARTAAGILGHWFVGYAAHAWGERRYVVPGAKESGTNVWILGVVSFGEGFHNNHHRFSGSARMGLAWHEVDLGWLSLRAMAALGLVSDVAEVAPDEAHAARTRARARRRSAPRRRAAPRPAKPRSRSA